MTLSETARSAGISVSYLSSIETGNNLPSLPILARTVAALGLSLNEVLRNVGQNNLRVSRLTDDKPGEQELSQRDLQLTIVSLVAEPGAEGPSPVQVQSSDVFVYVRAGALEVVVDGGNHLLLAGDSLYAEAPTSIEYRVVGDQRALGIWAAGPHSETSSRRSSPVAS